MNAAVTGGTGFLGGVLLKRLVPEARSVRVLVRRPECDAAIRAVGAEPVRGDLDADEGVPDFVRDGDVVFHVAARVDVRGAWKDFERTTVGGTRRLLDAALPHGPKHFIYISSIGVYDPSAPHPWSAEHTPTRPPQYNFYGRAKRMAEDLVRTRCAEAGCDWTILRFCFVYGPGNRPLLNQMKPMLKAGRLYLVGDGTNRIATLFVDDAVRAILMASTHPEAVGKIYNVAGDETVTQRELVAAMARAFGVPRDATRVGARFAFAAATIAEAGARLVRRSPPFNRLMITLMRADQVVDASRIRNELGWRPAVSFEEGMRRVGDWYRQLQAAGDPGIPGAMVSTG